MGCLPFLMILFTALVASVRPIEPYVPPDGTDIYEAASGTWDWDARPGSCSENPHTITFSPDRLTMLLTHAKPLDGDTDRVTRYEIREVAPSGIRGFMIGETRRDDAGQLVVWDLILTSPNTYRWHRVDWPAGSYTPQVVRCDVASGPRSHDSP